MAANNPSYRPWIIRILFIVFAIVLVGRLLQMQLLDNRYKLWANDQAIVRNVIFPPRGSILDRKGKELVINEISYELAVTPSKVKNIDTFALCQMLSISPEEFTKTMQQLVARNSAVRTSVFKPFLSEADLAKIQENIYQFDGFELRPRFTRSYPEGTAPHVLGYIHEVSKAMLKQERYQSYRSGDVIGISGLENVYEEALRGQRGVAYMIRDVLNRPRHSYQNGALDTPAIAGKNLELYLDADLQKFGESLMQNKIGSVVALDPKTGGILAMVSTPTYDPASLSGGDFSKNYSKLFMEYTRPLFNYAIQGQYPPGSTFKPIDAVIALDVGAITPEFGYPCRGGYYACGRRVGCTESWGGHANNLRLAIAWSCNAYFCDVFRRIVDAKKWGGDVAVGLQGWHDYLASFGIGHPLGVDITGESGGNIPDSSYYNSLYKINSWNSCNMVTNGLGQGEVTLTPLQLVNATAMIANKGYYYTPHFVKSIGGNTKAPALKKYLVKNEVAHISPSVFEEVIDGMEDVVKNGTGRRAQIQGIAVCGKTGTAENYGIIRGKRTKLDNHSLFICFAPKDDPKIAVAVVVQNSGYGATWAAPIASLMMEKYLKDTISRPELVTRMQQGNTIKSYVRTIDSVQREKDNIRYLLQTADKRTRDSLKRKNDTLLIKQVLDDFFKF